MDHNEPEFASITDENGQPINRTVAQQPRSDFDNLQLIICDNTTTTENQSPDRAATLTSEETQLSDGMPIILCSLFI